MSRFYYLFPVSQVVNVVPEIVSVDDCIYLRVTFNLKNGDIHTSQTDDDAVDTLDEAFELLKETYEELRWRYRDLVINLYGEGVLKFD